jgi:cyclohexanone monooxygenase/acetone monooxygenase
MAAAPTDAGDDGPPATVLDAVVLGAGLAGLYELHQLREQGLRVRAYDAADDVGGSWWWHGFPGARVDTESYVYQYLFSQELYEQWSWSERFPAGYEVLRWLRFLADRLDLPRDIRLSTRIESARYDEDRGRWTVRTDHGESIDTQFVVACVGSLAPPEPLEGLEGRDRFAGTLLHTGRWPWKGPDLTGARVGVVGAGTTAVQLVPKIVDRVGRLTVFADDPPYVLPMSNPAYGWQDREKDKARFAEFRASVPHSITGFADETAPLRTDATPDEQRAVLEELYRDGSLKLWLASTVDAEVSEAVAAFVREKMRARLGDPRLIDVLVPTERFDARRPALDTGYLEVFHRDDVELVGVVDNPVVRLRPEGVELADGTVHACDAVVVAGGFDDGTSALTRVDIRGRGGRSLAEEWGRGVHPTMGLATHGFPNLLTTAAPLAPSAATANTTPVLQQQTEWIAAAIRDLRARGGSTIEPAAPGEDAGVARDVGAYRQQCAQEAAADYPAFTRA